MRDDLLAGFELAAPNGLQDLLGLRERKVAKEINLLDERQHVDRLRKVRTLLEIERDRGFDAFLGDAEARVGGDRAARGVDQAQARLDARWQRGEHRDRRVDRRHAGLVQDQRLVPAVLEEEVGALGRQVAVGEHLAQEGRLVARVAAVEDALGAAVGREADARDGVDRVVEVDLAAVDVHRSVHRHGREAEERHELGRRHVGDRRVLAHERLHDGVGREDGDLALLADLLEHAGIVIGVAVRENDRLGHSRWNA